MNLSPQRPVLFINPVSGGGKAARAHLAQAATDRGIEPVVLKPGEGLGDRPRVPGMRPALDGGRLGVLLLHNPGDPRRRPGRAWTARSLRVTAAETVAAGVDGEAVRLTPPLHFAIRPRAIRVRVSRAVMRTG
jgi:diacylglycerol kinase family enzyme